MNVFKDLGKKYFPGSSITGKAYQDLSFLGEKVPSHRIGTEQRAAHIAKNFDLNGLVGLDVGCSVGGLSMALTKNHGPVEMVGVDIDHQSINVGNHLAQKHNLNASFQVMNIVSEEFESFLADQEFDFCIWYSNFMWIAKEHGWDKAFEVMELITSNIPVLFFETSQSKKDGVAAEFSLDGPAGIEKALREHSSYKTVKNLGVPPGQKWNNRSVFIAY